MKEYNLSKSLPTTININSIKDDGIYSDAKNKIYDANNINFSLYKPKTTIIYFYKITNTNISYSFREQQKINENSFNYLNNGKNMFKGNIYDINNLNSLEKNIKSDYKMMSFKTIFTPDEKSNITIEFKELYNNI